MPLAPPRAPAGVPYLLRQKWAAIRGFLSGVYRVKPFRNKTLRLNIDDETKIAAALEAAASAHGKDVSIGSYPVSALSPSLSLSSLSSLPLYPGYWWTEVCVAHLFFPFHLPPSLPLSLLQASDPCRKMYASLCHSMHPVTLSFLTPPFTHTKVSQQHDGARILLSLDGKLAGPIESAAALLGQLLPPGCIIGVEENVRSLLRAHSSVSLSLR